jgi:hypothetical protein
MLHRLERAKNAGAKGIIITLDWSFSNGRDWGSPWIPEKIDLKAMIKLAPEALSRPKWLWSFLKTGKIPDLTAPNMTTPGGSAPTFFGAYYEWMQTPLPTWSDVAWIRSQWDGPFMVKGVCRVDDARRVVDLGATTLSVSNHGGNNLDGTPAPIRNLAAIADAVGNDIEMHDADGNQLIGKVLEVEEAHVRMDFNHPLAGFDLHFVGDVVEGLRRAIWAEVIDSRMEAQRRLLHRAAGGQCALNRGHDVGGRVFVEVVGNIDDHGCFPVAVGRRTCQTISA